ncbi:hypothetical protein GOODEAATRI_010114, partial [Goodea atripinnis]
DHCKQGEALLTRLERWDDVSSPDLHIYEVKVHSFWAQLQDFSQRVKGTGQNIERAVQLYRFLDQESGHISSSSVCRALTQSPPSGIGPDRRRRSQEKQVHPAASVTSPPSSDSVRLSLKPPGRFSVTVLSGLRLRGGENRGSHGLSNQRAFLVLERLLTGGADVTDSRAPEPPSGLRSNALDQIRNDRTRKCLLAYGWALEGMRQLAAISMEDCTQPDKCRAVIGCLEDYRLKHSPIPESRFQEMKAEAGELRGERGLRQWSFAWSKCQETKKMFDRKMEAALRTRDSAHRHRSHSVISTCSASSRKSGLWGICETSSYPLEEETSTSPPTPQRTPFLRRLLRSSSYVESERQDVCAPFPSLSRLNSSPSFTPSFPSVPSSPSFPSSSSSSSSRRQQLRKTQSFDCPSTPEVSRCGVSPRTVSEPPHRGNTGVFIRGLEVSSPEAADRTLCPRTPVQGWAVPQSPGTPGTSTGESRPRGRWVIIVLLHQPALGFHSKTKQRKQTGQRRFPPKTLKQEAHESNISGMYLARGCKSEHRKMFLSKQDVLKVGAVCINALNNRILCSKLRHIVEEMVTTEREYVRSLRYIIHHYFPEMERADLPQDLRGKRSIIFGNLEKLLNFHSQFFLKELEACWKHPLRVPHCFLRHVRHILSNLSVFYGM